MEPNDDVDDGWRNVSRYIRRELDRAGGSIRALAAASGVDARTITKLLNGEPVTRRPALVRLAKFFDWPTDAFERMRNFQAPTRMHEVEDLREAAREAEARFNKLNFKLHTERLSDDEDALLQHWAVEAERLEQRADRLEREVYGLPEAAEVPAALGGKLANLTPEELAKLDAYIDGLIQGRG